MRRPIPCELTFTDVASSYNLLVVPLVQERFDLLVDRQHYFEQFLQRLWSFYQTERYAQQVKFIAGHDTWSLLQQQLASVLVNLIILH